MALSAAGETLLREDGVVSVSSCPGRITSAQVVTLYQRTKEMRDQGFNIELIVQRYRNGTERRLVHAYKFSIGMSLLITPEGVVL